jgi:hypothetical protein
MRIKATCFPASADFPLLKIRIFADLQLWQFKQNDRKGKNYYFNLRRIFRGGVEYML